MLVLTRKQNEKICIGDSITITVLRMKGKAVRLGIEAPHDINVIRGELCFELPEEESTTAVEPSSEADAIAVPPKSRPRVAKLRGKVSSEATAHWPLASQQEQDRASETCALPVDTAPLRPMIEARVH